jgi:hypothetical protein
MNLIKSIKLIVSISIILLYSNEMVSQKTEVNALLLSGTIVGGYVDNGIYLNFTGPGVKLQKGSSDLMIGVLPSLRFKEDNGTTKNSLVTPSLGLGITYTYKSIAVQIPFYYNSKTAITDGRWNIGIGVGLKLNQLNTNKK